MTKPKTPTRKEITVEVLRYRSSYLKPFLSAVEDIPEEYRDFADLDIEEVSDSYGDGHTNFIVLSYRRPETEKEALAREAKEEQSKLAYLARQQKADEEQYRKLRAKLFKTGDV